MSVSRIAIVGAGAAGLAAAASLQAAGGDVVLFDKGRFPGGRLATRDSPWGGFDHGAQFLRLRDAGLRDEAARWCRAGCLAGWPQQAAEVPAWVGTPSMRALAAAWARPFELHGGQAVQAIDGTPFSWSLRVAGGGVAGPFSRVLVTVPAPQARPWFAGSGIAPVLAAVRYAPCWTMMWVPAAGRLPPETVFGAAADGLDWIAREDGKPGRDGAPRYLVHADADWSTAHLDEDGPDVAVALRQRAATRLGIDATAVHAVAHRWRHARVTEAAQQPVLSSGDGRYYAGDGCLGGRVEAALLSGRSAAQRILEDGDDR